MTSNYNGIEFDIKFGKVLEAEVEAVVLGTDVYLMNRNSFSEKKDE